MSVRLQNLEAQVIHFFKRYGKYIIGGLIAGLLSYFMMMACNLVNHVDGIWHPSNFIAGDWEISLGRGLQRYSDKLRFGIVSDPFNILLTLLMLTTGNAIVIMKFERITSCEAACVSNATKHVQAATAGCESSVHFDSKIYKGLFITSLIANPVVCNLLSYSYLAVNYALAYLLSIVCFGFVRTNMEDKKKVLAGVLMGGASLGLSMALYQTYICVTCVLMAMYIIKMVLDGKKLRGIFQYIASCACTGVFGAVVYLIVNKALLFRAGVEMASYRGADNISPLLILKELPNSLKECYLQCWDYFYHGKAASNLQYVDIILAGLFCVYLVAAVIQFVKLWKGSKVHAVLFAVMLLLLPVASCVILLIAVGNTMSGLMSVGMVVCVVMLGIIIPGEKKTGFWMKRIYYLLLVAFTWYQLMAVINDQVALKEGKTATINLAENVVSQLYEGGYIDEFQQVAFVGRPGDNDRFAKSAAFYMANDYARFGCWSMDARNNRASWAGVLANFVGVNMNLCDVADYHKLVGMERVINMPQFPLEGSIQVIDDIVVVKIADLN